MDMQTITIRKGNSPTELQMHLIAEYQEHRKELLASNNSNRPQVVLISCGDTKSFDYLSMVLDEELSVFEHHIYRNVNTYDEFIKIIRCHSMDKSVTYYIDNLIDSILTVPELLQLMSIPESADIAMQFDVTVNIHK